MKWSVYLLQSKGAFARPHHSTENMSDTMIRNMWIGIGIIAIVLFVYGYFTVRRRR